MDSEQKSTGLYDTYVRAGRDELLSLESLDRELSLQTIGIVAFSFAAFGVAYSSIIPKVVQSLLPGRAANGEADCLALLAIILVVLSVFSVIGHAYLIVRPSGWVRPFDLAKVRDALKEYPPEKIKKGLGNGYTEAVARNREISSVKQGNVKRLAFSALSQLVLISILFLYSLYLSILPV